MGSRTVHAKMIVNRLVGFNPITANSRVAAHTGTIMLNPRMLFSTAKNRFSIGPIHGFIEMLSMPSDT